MKENKLSKKKWSNVIEKLLRKHPYNWDKRNAIKYSLALQDGFYDENYDPEEALIEDRTNW